MKSGDAEASPLDAAQTPNERNLATVENVILDYMYETSPSGASGDNSLAVDSIQFHPNYVLVRASNGNTSLFAVERLRRFSYRFADSK